MPATCPLETLKFVTRAEGDRLDFWNPPIPQSWATGNELGRQYAQDLLALALSEETVIDTVLRTITIKGHLGSVEVGLFRGLASAAAAGVRRAAFRA